MIYHIIIILILFMIINYYFNNVENFSSNKLNIKPPFPIDVVYTWAGEQNTSNARLANNNELKYSLRSVMKYAPWVNKIYILMNPPKKKPSWFNNKYSDKIILVDHYDTFKNKNHLPSTNSNAIETTMVNIPGLSEHFIYFNDDVYLGNYVSYLDFFNKDGSKIIVDDLPLNKCKSMIINDQSESIDMILPFYCGISQHIPFACKKSIIKEYQKDYTDYIEFIRNIKSRKGTGKTICHDNNLHKWCQQQHGPIAKFSYDNNYAISYKFPKNQIIYVSYQFDPYLKALNRIKKTKPKFYCINDTNIENNENRKIFYDKVNNFMEKYYPEKPFFEKK